MILALETSGSVGTVAVGTAQGEVRAEVVLEERRRHAARLVPAVAGVLEEAGVARTDLEGVVVGEGPGSFTGVRVAAATAKGLALGLGIPLRAVSSLAAAALAGPWEEDARRAPGHPAVRYVLFDARGDRIYGACYGVGEAGVEELVAPWAGTLREALAGDVPAGAVFVGDGARRHEGPIRGAGYSVEGLPRGRPTARALLRWMRLHPETPPVEATATWEPDYLRASNAEREWQG